MHPSKIKLNNLTMSIYFSGTFKRSAGVVSAIQKQLKLVNLKPVKKIEVTFDPFHSQAKIVRDFIHFFSAKQVLNTNLSCIFKTNVVCDRRDPKISVNLADSSIITYEAANLTVLEILQQFNTLISSTFHEQKTDDQPTIKTKLKSKKTKKNNGK